MRQKYSFARCLVGDLRYMIASYRFVWACIGYTVISLVSILDEMKAFPEASVFYLYTVYYYYPFWLLFLLFAVISGGASFCVDWENRYFRYRILRYGKKNYAVSKALSCFLSAATLIFISQWMFILFISMEHNVWNQSDSAIMDARVYYSLMNETGIWFYFLIRILMLAACAGFFAVISLWISTKIVNVFVALASPIIVYYVVDNLTVALDLPFFVSVSKIVRGMIEIHAGPMATLLYAISFFSGLALLFVVAFYFECRKRCENG